MVGVQGALVRNQLAHRAVLALKLQYLFAGEHGDAQFLQVVSRHGGQIGGKLGGQQMVQQLDDRGPDAPLIGQSHGHFQADEAAAHDDGVVYLSGRAVRLNGLGRLQTGDGADVLRSWPGMAALWACCRWR